LKYFDKIPAPVEDELIKRGVSINNLLYCVKADMDGEGCYYDCYITFNKDTLYIISGYETYSRITKKTDKSRLISYEVKDFSELLVNQIEDMYIDRHQNTARLIVKEKEKEYPIARLSIGYSDKFEKFAERVNLTHKEEKIDDTLLDELKIYCPTCGAPYPDPNRPICPHCMDRHSVFRRLMGMFREFRLAMFGILFCIALSGGFTILSPYFGTKLLYDDVLSKEGSYYGQILLVVLLMAGVSLIGRILNIASSLILAFVVPTVTHRLRCKIFSAMQTLSLPFFTSKQTGSLMTRVDQDSENIYWFFVDIVPYGLMNFAKIVGIAVVMFMLSPILSSGILLIIVTIQVIQSKFYGNQRKLYRKLNVATRASTAVLSDAMNGQRVVKAFAKEDQEIKRYGIKNNEMFTIDSMINQRIANSVPAIWMFCRLISNLLGIFGAVLILKGELALGALTALLSYTDMTYEPISFFTWIGDRWAKCVDAASRMFEILDSTPTIKEKENPVHISKMKGDIELKNVSFEYEAGRPIIKDVSFKVQAGQMFGIVGKTGAGKSTIINLMARLYDVTGGEILMDGVKLKDIALKDLRKNIGIVSQETYLFMGTIEENIKYAREDATMEEVIEAAKAAHAHEFIVKLPEGYNTKIGSGGVSLSGGERQRLSIARAIIQKPNILILDEATASMDTRTERKIQTAIDELKKGRTIIAIAHRLSTLRDADMLCVIENGELKEMGTHDELIHSKGKYYELYKLQSEALKFIGFDEAC
jgi:ATP-binding cassette subfamily B protein